MNYIFSQPEVSLREIVETGIAHRTILKCNIVELRNWYIIDERRFVLRGTFIKCPIQFGIPKAP